MTSHVHVAYEREYLVHIGKFGFLFSEIVKEQAGAAARSLRNA